MSDSNEVKTIEVDGKTYDIDDLNDQQKMMVNMYMAWALEKEKHELELSKVTLAMESLIQHLKNNLESTGE